MKVYAVKRGHRTGLFYSLADAEAQIKDFPNAEYKIFKSLNTAVEYLSEEDIPLDLKDKYYAYVDGSNLSDGSMYSGSAVITINDEVVETKTLIGAHPEFVAKRNVAGEIMGSLLALAWAVEHNIKEIYICHDYVGVGKWATGAFKARDSLSQLYKRQVDLCVANGMKIKFIKVDGHTGVKYNEFADRLAKKALGIGGRQ